jgi:hypothetical protein
MDSMLISAAPILTVYIVDSAKVLRRKHLSSSNACRAVKTQNKCTIFIYIYIYICTYIFIYVSIYYIYIMDTDAGNPLLTEYICTYIFIYVSIYYIYIMDAAAANLAGGYTEVCREY